MQVGPYLAASQGRGRVEGPTFAASLSLISKFETEGMSTSKKQVITESSSAKQFKPPPSWPHEIAWGYTHTEPYFTL